MVTNGGAINGPVTVLDGTLAVQGNIRSLEAITLNGSGVGGVGALRNLSGFNELDGAITLGSAARINADAGELFMGGGISGAFDLTFGGGAARIIVDREGIDTGSGSVTMDGIGILFMGGSNTYTGTTTVNSGTVEVAFGNALSDSAGLIVNAGGMVRVFNSETVGNIAGAGNIAVGRTSGQQTLTFGDATASSTFSGVISDNSSAGNLVKQGTGSVTLSGANTYTGTTTINAGTLVAASNTALGTTAGGTTVANGATLAVQGNIGSAEAITLNGTGVDGGGALRSLSGSNFTVGAITLGSDTRINSDANTLSLNGGITGNNTDLTFGGAGNIRVSNTQLSTKRSQVQTH